MREKILTEPDVPDIVSMPTGASLAVSIRTHSLRLASARDASLEQHGLRAVFGSTVERTDLVDTRFSWSATKEAERTKFPARRAGILRGQHET